MLLEILRTHGVADPERPALDPVVAPTISYHAFSERVRARVADLSGRGVSEAPIALQLDHGEDSAVLEVALLEARIPVLSLPLFFSPAQKEYAVASCGARDLHHRAPTAGDLLRNVAPSDGLLPQGRRGSLSLRDRPARPRAFACPLSTC